MKLKISVRELGEFVLADSQQVVSLKEGETKIVPIRKGIYTQKWAITKDKEGKIHQERIGEG